VSVDQFLALIQTAGAGVTVLLGYLLWDERKEHKATRANLSHVLSAAKDEANSTTREVVTAVESVRSALDRIGDVQLEVRSSLTKVAEGVTILSARRSGRGGA
jgi:hypothetical protein